jgi:hypothetical protein
MPVELPVGFPATQDEALVAAAFVGCPEETAVKAWNKAMSRGGRDSKDIPIRNWRAHLATEWAYERQRIAERPPVTPSKPEQPTGTPTKQAVMDYAKEKWGDDQRHMNWGVSFYSHWNNPKRNWMRNGYVIDWKIEFSTQVSKWRGTAQ